MPIKEPITIEGNLIADPELGQTREGKDYAKFTVAVNDRRYNEETQRFEDVGEPFFHDVAVYGNQARNVMHSLKKGDNVLAAGNIHFQVYEVDGQRRQGTQIVADTVGPSLRFNSVDVNRNAPKVTGPSAEYNGPVSTPDRSAQSSPAMQ